MKRATVMSLGGLLVCVVAIRVFGLVGWVRGVIQGTTRTPVRMVAQTVSRLTTWRPKEWCAASNMQDARQAIERLSAAEGTIRSLQEENATLRSLARVAQNEHSSWVGAQVISRDVRKDRARLLLDRGEQDGIRLGQAVLSGTGVVIGKIASLEPKTSVVELVTDPQSRFAVALDTSSTKKLVGVLEGRGRGAAWLMYIPVQTPIAQDQTIWTAGTEDEIPKYLPIGIVNDVRGTKADPFLQASIEPLVNPEDVTVVYILGLHS